MPHKSHLRVLLVDPSLFTAPYDAALTEGLLAADVEPVWATRPTRVGDRQELPLAYTDPFFYRRVDEARWIPRALKPVAKGLAHAAGLLGLLRRVRRLQPDVVHFQWVVVPLLDLPAMALIQRLFCPVVLTVHDTVAYNGQKMSWLQRLGHDGPTRLASRVIVHTQGGRRALVERGIEARRIAVIPHGALQLAVPLPEIATPDPRWTCLLFGEIKPYKGLDVLIEAIGLLPPDQRAGLRVIVAGRPRMDMAPLLARIDELGIAAQFELRLQRQSEEEMAALFAAADCFLFPYRQIDASGVYFLVKSLGKWLIASRVGIFAEDIDDGVQGALLPGGDALALAGALAHGLRERPAGAAARASDAWVAIGRSTRALYEDATATGLPAPNKLQAG